MKCFCCEKDGNSLKCSSRYRWCKNCTEDCFYNDDSKWCQWKIDQLTKKRKTELVQKEKQKREALIAKWKGRFWKVYYVLKSTFKETYWFLVSLGSLSGLVVLIILILQITGKI